MANSYDVLKEKKTRLTNLHWNQECETWSCEKCSKEYPPQSISAIVDCGNGRCECGKFIVRLVV